MYRPQTQCEWIFFGTAAVYAACNAALEIVVLVQYQSWVNPVVYQVPRSYVVPVNFSVFFFGYIYQAVLSFDAMRTKNNLQVFGICIFNLCLFLLSIMRYDQTSTYVLRLSESHTMYNEPFVDESVPFWPIVKPALLSSAVINGLSTIIMCFYAYKLHYEFSWALYRHIQGSREMKRRYMAYEILLVLIKLETYFFLGFVVVYGFVDVHYQPPEFQLTMCLIPMALAQIALIIHYIRTEGKVGATIAIVLRLGEIAYLVSRIIVLCGNGQRANTILKNEMFLFAGTAVAFAAFTCINAIVCVANFNHGLKPLLLYPSWQQKSRPADFQLVHTQPRYAERLELD